MGALAEHFCSYSEKLLTEFLIRLIPVITPIIRFTILSICIMWKQYELWASSSTYKSIMNDKSAKFVCRRSEEDQCSICLSEFVRGESCREILDCKHVFHGKCLEKWLKGYRATCPLCRGVVVPEPIVEEHRLLQIERSKLTERLCSFSNVMNDEATFFI